MAKRNAPVKKLSKRKPIGVQNGKGERGDGPGHPWQGASKV